jgi:hypothetical protein
MFKNVVIYDIESDEIVSSIRTHELRAEYVKSHLRHALAMSDDADRFDIRIDSEG